MRAGALAAAAVTVLALTACGGTTPTGDTGSPTPTSTVLAAAPHLQLGPASGPVGTMVEAAGTVSPSAACPVVRVTVARAGGGAAAVDRYVDETGGRFAARFALPSLPTGQAIVRAYCTAAAGNQTALSETGEASFTVTPACSAAGLAPDAGAQTGLPPAVEQMRADLAAAAVACDYGTLATTLADRNGAGVRFTFGAPGDPAGFWRQQEAEHADAPPMRALRAVLGLSYGVLRMADGTVLYEWPAAFATTHPTDAQLGEIAATGLYPIATLREWVETGNGYLGYRVVISANGDWLAFVAGD